MPSLDLTITATTGRLFVSLLGRKIPAAHKAIKSPVRELSIALVGESKMAELHWRFMEIDSPTDVLTFPLETDSRSRVISGEVVVCVPVALRQARVAGSKPENEVLLYALHGLLHLSGWDDRTDPEYRRMHAMEDRILRQLGIGPVFQPARKKGRP